MTRTRLAAALACVLLVAAYSNHFVNGFHFDDDHAIVNNPLVRSLRYVPRYFVDATTFSVLPLNRSYRPIAQTTFALDYWLGSGYHASIFQADTFVWFVLLLAATTVLAWRLTGSGVQAIVCAAAFGLHPAVADTVNYIVQRAEILAALGVVAALAMYAWWPRARRGAWYLAPLMFGLLSKQTAAAFPLLLACYAWTYEGRWWTRDVGIAAAATAAAAVWIVWRTPASTAYLSANRSAYLLTQPYVALRYFISFFAPVSLSVDYDWPLAAGAGDPIVAGGIVFVIGVGWVAWRLRRTRAGRTVSFGLAWFLIAQLPTALVPLTEVANDWRMLLPFVGLSLAVVCAVTSIVASVAQPFRAAGRLAGLKACTTAAVILALAAEAFAAHARNEVWRTDESLWRDAVAKSPENGRAWMNYGVALMARGDYAGAVDACERALPLAPDYSLLHVNLGVAYGAVGRVADAEREFRAAQRLAPDDWRTHLYYARWLAGRGRADEARREAARAAALNPLALANHHM